MRSRLLLILGVFGAARCADLPQKQLNTCGNGVIEPALGEQCDTVTNPKLGAGTDCGKPDDPARACHYICTPGSTAPKCPTNWICDPDGICRFKMGVCGNGIIDGNGEDCDLTTDPKLGPGTVCGAPDAPVGACRYLCMSGSDTAACPTGWHCGLDSICRYPAGTFTESGSHDLPVYDIAIGDFDGNLYPDVAGFDTTHVRVLYGDVDHSLGHPLELNVEEIIGQPAVGDIDSDGTADLILPELSGVFVLRGQSDRTLAPVAFSPISVPLHEVIVLPSLLTPQSLEHIPVVVGKGIRADADKFVLLVATPDSTGAIPGGCNDLRRTTCFPDQGHRFSDIAGRVPVARFPDLTVGGQPISSEAFVLALRGDSFVRIFAPVIEPPDSAIKLELVDHGTISLPGSVALPIGDGQTGAVQISDLDGDGNLDLLVSISDASGNPALAIAYGDGLGRFHGSDGSIDGASVHRFVALSVTDGQAQYFGELGFPFAIGDLNGDGLPDFIGRVAIKPMAGGPVLTEQNVLSGLNAVLLTATRNARTSSVVLVLESDQARTWDEAAIGDFNRDGIPDFVAVSHTDSNVDIYVGAGGGLFNGGRAAVMYPPSSLRVGDFNGDRVTDLALVEDGCQSSTNATSLTVIFGDLDFFASKPVPMGCLNFIQDMEPGFAAPDFAHVDRTSDLIVVSNTVRDSSGDASVAIMRGTSQRRMLSPFLLTSAARRDNFPVGVAVGHFDASGHNALDMIATSFAPDQRLPGLPHPTAWFIKGSDNGQFAAANAVPVPLDEGAAGDCLGGAFDIGCFIWTAGDLDGNPPAEIVGFDISDFCAKSPPAVKRSRLVILKQIPGSGGNLALSCQHYDLLPARGAAEELFLADLNGDQRPELVARFSSSILVYWNTGSGIVPDAANISVVPAPPGTALGSFFPLAATALNAGAGADLQIAYATSAGVFLSAFDTGRIFHTKRGSVVPFQPSGKPITGTIPGMAGAWRLRTADMDRDGLDDLVLLESGRLHLYPAVEHSPIGAGP